MKPLLFIITSLLSILLYGQTQKGFADGYIVNYNNDTIKGKIKDRAFLARCNSKKIKFINANGKKSKLSAKKIKAYSKQNGLNYRSIIQPYWVFNKKVFAEVLEDGEVILLRWDYDLKGRYGSVIHYYFLQRRGVSDSCDGETVLALTINYPTYFKKCPEVQKLIEEKTLDYNDIQVIVRKYNECVGKKQSQ
ncbi:MAG TPA: hypothetical protein VF411_00140 [Bacteroidia bacterium]